MQKKYNDRRSFDRARFNKYFEQLHASYLTETYLKPKQ